MIVYQTTPRGVTAGQLTGFFAGWPDPPSPEAHLRILEGSDHVVLALDTRSDTVVGFITAISDGVISAYIPLLEVLPGYRRQGIRGELVHRMLAQIDHLYMVDLVCDRAPQPFYERFGMRPGLALMIRNRDRRAGA